MSGGLPYARWFGADWLSDDKVQICSLAAQGLWINLLCRMFQTGGYLTIADPKNEPKVIGKLTGNAPKVIKRLLAELETAGVFSRSDDGIIYSRRILRDIAKAQQDQENGRKGGNPKLENGVNPPVNPPLNPPLKPRLNGGDKARAIASIPTPRGSPLGLRPKEDSSHQDRDCEIARRADGPAISRDDDSAALDTLERKVMKLYDPPEAMRIITASHGDSVRSRWGYLGSFVAKAESQHPPPPKPDKAERERERLRQEARALGLNV